MSLNETDETSSLVLKNSWALDIISIITSFGSKFTEPTIALIYFFSYSNVKAPKSQTYFVF